ncbi:MAG TPA: tetratricopeptide repeat protein [Polyangiaceae bacterium]|nr:tetratricopeptide repeat protein [Polyangiaceae bacterium]
MRFSPVRLSTVLWMIAATSGCTSSGSVTRMVSGRGVDGRFVADQAYAAYLQGVVLETRGRFDDAAKAYAEGIRHDPDSAELWTRIGVLRCARTAQTSPEGPWDAFARASEIDPEYEETWTERARCHLRRGELDLANRAARVAVSLDPKRTEAAVLLAMILERQGRIDEARRWLDGLVVLWPTSLQAEEAMLAFAARTRDEVRREAAEAALSELRPRQDERQPLRRARPTLTEIDGALREGAFEAAKRMAITAHLASGALALRAVALGKVDFARAHADLVLTADPTDVDAYVAAAVAADLARDEGGLLRSLSTAPKLVGPPSPLATLLFGELLDRRIGKAAAQAWRNAAPSVTPGDDPLIRTVAARR